MPAGSGKRKALGELRIVRHKIQPFARRRSGGIRRTTSSFKLSEILRSAHREPAAPCRSYQTVWIRPQQSQIVFLSAGRGARSGHSDHRIHHVRSLSRENLRTNIHPTDAAVAPPIRPPLSEPKSSGPQSLRRPLSTGFPPPQNHPLETLVGKAQRVARRHRVYPRRIIISLAMSRTGRGSLPFAFLRRSSFVLKCPLHCIASLL